jgi:hypothetical protein
MPADFSARRHFSVWVSLGVATATYGMNSTALVLAAYRAYCLAIGFRS